MIFNTVFKEEPESGRGCVGYIPEKDCYLFCIDKKDFEKELETRRHIPFEIFASDEREKLKKSLIKVLLGGENFQKYDISDLLVEFASHEVRHRAQYLRQINKFSPEDVLEAKNPYLKGIIRYVTIDFSIAKRLGIGVYKDGVTREKRHEEFDARVISLLAVGIWGKTGSLRKVGEVIKEDKEVLLNHYEELEDRYN
jgi:hypothetical protein